MSVQVGWLSPVLSGEIYSRISSKCGLWAYVGRRRAPRHSCSAFLLYRLASHSTPYTYFIAFYGNNFKPEWTNNNDLE